MHRERFVTEKHPRGKHVFGCLRETGGPRKHRAVCWVNSLRDTAETGKTERNIRLGERDFSEDNR